VSQPGGPSASVGRPLGRVEDADLLSGHGRFGDDLAMRVGTLHAAILRSPYAHAELLAVDMKAASALPGVAAIVTGDDARRWTRPLIAAVKAPVEHWCLAVDRVRYVGEPVAVVLAVDRYAAADALERIEVSYRPLPAVIDPVAAAESAAPLLHTALGCNVISDRSFCYGDPKPNLLPLPTGSRSRPLTRVIPAPRSSALW
jgi:2-furoyl-CoA dehydrogenase large subunit